MGGSDRCRVTGLTFMTSSEKVEETAVEISVSWSSSSRALQQKEEPV